MPKVKEKKAAVEKKPRAPKNTHPLAAPLPEGEILTDFTKKGFWKTGKPIGSGGFGLIYLAQPDDGRPVGPNAKYVMKVEPKNNGPLFCELHFYQRVAKAEMVKSWITSHGLKSLGMPQFIASGIHERGSVCYRFMVMQRFGTDLQKLFETNNKIFPEETVFTLAAQLVDVLEYIHDHDYVHADIKASNLLLDDSGKQAFLVDYGLAFRFCCDGAHKEYREDPKRCHDGTIEFTSRDAHKGVAPSRRGDMEILGYCLLQWLCQRLPWEDKLGNKEYVRDQKIKYMKDIPSLMKKCFPAGNHPEVIKKYLDYVNTLDYEDKPDYQYCRQMFSKALKALGCPTASRLNFSAAAASIPKASKGRKRTLASDDSSVSPPKSARKSPVKKTSTPSSATPKGRGAGASGEKSATTNIRKSPQVIAKSPLSPAKRGTPVKPLPKVRYPPVNSPARGAAKKPMPGKRIRKSRAEMVSHATQTSPGLKGLRRSRKK